MGCIVIHQFRNNPFFSSYAVTSLHIDYGTLILLCTVTKRCVLFFECVNDYTIIKQQGCK